MAVLNKNWATLDRVSPKETGVVTGSSSEEAEEASEPKIADEPILVYVPDPEGGELCKAEKVVLMNDKVCIGMWAFKCVKMTDEEAQADELLAKGKEVPRFYVVNRDYRKVQLLEGSGMSAGKLFKAMEKSANKAYKQKLGKTVDGMLKILNEYDKIANEKKVLEAKKARNDGETDKKMEKDFAELEEREAEAKEEHKKLTKFELR